MSLVTDKDLRQVVKAFVENNSVVRCQQESYEDFLCRANDYLNGNVISHGGHVIKFVKPKFIPPHRENSEGDTELVFPVQCMNSGDSYSSNLYCDLHYKNPYSDRYKVYPKEHLGMIPVMVKSSLCNLSRHLHDPEKLVELCEDPYDPGGYFIAPEGKRKVNTNQNSKVLSRWYTLAEPSSKKSTKPVFYSEIRSSENDIMSNKTVKIILTNRLLYITLPHIQTPIEIHVLLRCLGYKTVEDMISILMGDRKDRYTLSTLLPSFQNIKILSKNDALSYIGKRGQKYKDKDDDEVEDISEEAMKNTVSYAKYILKDQFLSHLSTNEMKGYIIGRMTMEIVDLSRGCDPEGNKVFPTNRDHMMEKRTTTCGLLLIQSFIQSFKMMSKKIIKEMQKGTADGKKFKFRSALETCRNVITAGCFQPIKSGNWKMPEPIQGITQAAEYFNYHQFIALCNKRMNQFNPRSTSTVTRQLNASQYGAICPYDTPEDKKCGLIGATSLTASYTLGTNSNSVVSVITKMFDITPFSPIGDGTMIFVNEVPIGRISDPDRFIKKVVSLRRSLDIDMQTSVFRRKGDVHISTVSGRMCRPLLIVEDGKLLIPKKVCRNIKLGIFDKDCSPWMYLLQKGYVEYIDKNEEEDKFIAMYPSDLEQMSVGQRLQVTHCELHPSMMLGINAGLVVFSDHNQSPRIIYQASMGKQSVGIPGMNWRYRVNEDCFALINPEKPLISTMIERYTKLHETPAGQNVMIAIIPWYGYGQEDSLILNLDSIERGMFDTIHRISVVGIAKKEKSQLFEKPKQEECIGWSGNPEKLNDLGYVDVGTIVRKGDVIIGITEKLHQTSSISTKDRKNISLIYDKIWEAKVVYAHKGPNAEGYEQITIVLEQYRNIILGDKFSARHGQKGTVGKVYRSSDLPYTEAEGVAPDIIMNPLAIPSRMTIGQMIEILLGKKVASSSMLNQLTFKTFFNYTNPKHKNPKEPTGPKVKYSYFKADRDGTPFEKDFNLELIQEELAKLGHNRFGEGVMINGQTGEDLPGLIFNGPCFYQRLKHFAGDKCRARSRGPIVNLTRQPREGQKGGLRYGYMEKDCTFAHGAVNLIIDRMMDQSDPFKVAYCRKCGLEALDIRRKDVRFRSCGVCNTDDVAVVRIPYATKLLIQECRGMNIAIRVIGAGDGTPGNTASLVRGKRVIGRGIIMK